MDTPAYEPSSHSESKKKDSKKPPRGPRKKGKLRWILLGTAAAIAVATPFALKALSPWLLEQTTLTVERSLTDLLGNPVRFKAIVPRFQGLRPEVEFQGFEVVAPEGQTAEPKVLMQARAVRIQIDLVESLRLRQARFGRLVVEGLRVEAAQNASGDWEIRGVRTGATGGPSALVLPAWLSPALALELVDASIKVRAAKETREFNLARAQLQGGWSGQIYGSVTLEDFKWSWPSLYKEAQHWKTLSLGWKYTPGVSDSPRTSVKLEEIALRVGSTDVTGHTTVGWVAGAEPDLDIGLEVSSGGFAAIRALVPPSVIPSSVQSWLSKSIKRAQIEQAQFSLKGRPSKLEKLKLHMGLKDLDLEYLPGWPMLKDADGELDLEDHKLEFSIARAAAAGISLEKTRGAIANLDADAPILVIGSDSAAEEKPFVEFLKEGPLREQLAPVWEQIEWSGPAQVAWQWKVPLAGEGAPTGFIDIRGGAMKIKRGGVQADKLAGKIEVGATEVRATELKAEVLGEPARFEFSHPLAGKGIRTTKLEAELPVTAEQVATEFPVVKPWVTWEGKLRAKLALELSLPPAHTKSETKIGFKATSTLEGLKLAEPFLIAKEASETRWLAIEGELSGSKLARLEGRWAEKEDSQNPSIRWEYDPDGEGSLNVDARLTRLDWDPWEDRLKAKKGTPKKSADSASGGAPALGSLSVHLALDELAARSNVFHTVDLQFDKEGAGWNARLKSKEANGELNASLPLNKSTLEAKFTNLKLAHWPVRNAATATQGEGTESSPAPTEEKAASDEGEDAEEASSESAKGYAEWPSLALSVETMELGKEKLGAVKFRAKQTGERLTIDECSVKNAEYEMVCEGGKLVYSGASPATSFSGQIKIKELDHRLPLESVGAIEAAPGGKARFDFTWPGTPDRFEWAFLKGTLAGDIDRGKLKDVKLAQAGLLRLSNLNFHDDGTLDFRKFSFKLAFERGSLQFQPMKVYFGTTFMKIQGKVGVVSKQLDITRSVKTNIGRNIKHMLGIESDEEHEASNERDLYAAEPTEGLDVKRMKGTWEKPVEE